MNTTIPIGYIDHTITSSNAGHSVQEEVFEKRLKEACSEFQSILFTYMVKSMRESIDTSDLFSGGKAETMYRSLLDEQYASMLSKNTETTLAKALYNQLNPKHIEGTTISEARE